MSERYFLSSDDSGHEYVVPVSKKVDWYDWLNIPAEDERAWEPPPYAIRVEGRLTFTDPRTD